MTTTGDAGPIGRLVHYAGQVQGVGFRVTSTRLAQRFAVTGWVRNLADGRVRLHVEGAPAEVERFLSAVRERFAGYVEDEAVEDTPPTGRYHAFEITR